MCKPTEYMTCIHSSNECCFVLDVEKKSMLSISRHIVIVYFPVLLELLLELTTVVTAKCQLLMDLQGPYKTQDTCLVIFMYRKQAQSRRG